MKPELRIHVGLPKTGTSALQHFLFQTRNELARSDVYYSENVIEYRHQRLVAALLADFDPALLSSFLATDDDQTTVLSAEGFSHHIYRFPERNLAKFVEETQRYCRSVFLVLRERQAFLWSLYKQCLINPVIPSVPYFGKDVGFDDFVSIPYIRKLGDFAQIAEDLRRRFHAEVTVLDYDSLTLSEIYEQLTGATAPTDTSIEWVNTSFPDAAIEAIRKANGTLSGKARDAEIARILSISELASFSKETMKGAYDNP